MTFISSSSVSGESLQSVWVACRGTRGGNNRAWPHRPTSQWIWHLQLPLVLTGSLHATGLRHLATVSEGNGVCETNWVHLCVRPTERVRDRCCVCMHDVWAGDSVYVHTNKDTHTHKNMVTSGKKTPEHYPVVMSVWVCSGGRSSILLDVYEYLIHHWRGRVRPYF